MLTYFKFSPLRSIEVNPPLPGVHHNIGNYDWGANQRNLNFANIGIPDFNNNGC